MALRRPTLRSGIVYLVALALIILIATSVKSPQRSGPIQVIDPRGESFRFGPLPCVPALPCSPAVNKDGTAHALLIKTLSSYTAFCSVDTTSDAESSPQSTRRTVVVRVVQTTPSASRRSRRSRTTTLTGSTTAVRCTTSSSSALAAHG